MDFRLAYGLSLRVLRAFVTDGIQAPGCRQLFASKWSRVDSTDQGVGEAVRELDTHDAVWVALEMRQVWPFARLEGRRDEPDRVGLRCRIQATAVLAAFERALPDQHRIESGARY